MNMFIRRDQRSSLMGKVVFQLDVRAEISPEETASIARYGRSAYSEPYAEIEFVQKVLDETFGRVGRTPCKALRDAACEFVFQLLTQEPVIVGIPDAPDLDHISLPAMHELRNVAVGSIAGSGSV
jgi:hypothetical protein